MEHLSFHLLRYFVEEYALMAYLIIFLGVILEGEIVVIFAGIFSHLGSLDPYISLLFVILGGTARSIIGYTLGLYLQKNHSNVSFVKSLEKRITHVFPNFTEKPFWSIFISRFFIFGVGLLTLVFSGYKKIPLKIYAKAEGISLLLWSIGMLSLGFFFSYTALSISKDIRNFIGLIFAFFVLFFIVEKAVMFIIEIFSGSEK